MKNVADIFVRLPDGSPMWLEAVAGLPEARKRVRELRSQRNLEFFIYCECNGKIEREDHN